jgi:2'-5' RNA ligase
VFGLCLEGESPLVRAVASLYSEERWEPWLGDVRKFGPHVTLRGVFPLREERQAQWIEALRDVASRHAPVTLGPSALTTRFPQGLALSFRTTSDEAERLKHLAADVAEATRPFVRWLPITPFELSEARDAITSNTPDEAKRSELLSTLAKIERRVSEATLPPLPATPEYRLPLLLSVWDADNLREALFRWGDPFVHNFEPHLSLVALAPQGGSDSVSAKLTQAHPELIGQPGEIRAFHLMTESHEKAVIVSEPMPVRGMAVEARRPVWQIEHSITLSR